MKPVSLKKYKKFLKHLNLQKIRTESSHEIWDNPESPPLRPVTVDNNYKDVPLLHIHTSLKTLGISKEDFQKIISKL